MMPKDRPMGLLPGGYSRRATRDYPPEKVSMLVVLAVAMLSIVLLLSVVFPAHAAETIAQEARETAVSFNELMAPWWPSIIAAVVAFILTLLGVLTAWIKQKFNLDKSAANAQVDRNHRESLQSALTNAAGRLVLVLGVKLKDIELTIDMLEVRQSVEQVKHGAADAVLNAGLDDDMLASMLINKVGVLTASNPQLVPTTATAAPARPGMPS